MRVTNSMMISNMLNNLNKNLNVMSRKQDELSTGKRVIFASDDPVATAKILKFKTDISDMTQYSTNTRDAQSWLDASESSVAEMGQVLQRIRELSVQTSNGTYTSNDTTKVREEIIQLRDHLISAGNFNFAGKYLFSSNFTDQKLLNEDGTYNIPITAEDIADRPVAVYEVSHKEFLNVGTHGLDIFGYILDTSTFPTTMPSDAKVTGTAAQKAAVSVDFSLTTDYTAAAMGVSVNGSTYNLNVTGLKGTALSPLDRGTVLDRYLNASNGTNKLKDVADVYFDMNGKLIVRNKTVGTGGSVAHTNATGLSNAVNISTPSAPAALGSATATVNGVNALKATVSGAGAPTPITDFYGKKFVMTFNGTSKTFTFASSGTLAAMQADIQSQIDTAFGTGKVTANLSTMTFETVTGATDMNQPQLRVQSVVTTQNKMIKEINDYITALGTANQNGSMDMIAKIDVHLNQMLAVRADIGARNNRIENINTRIAENSVTFTRLLSGVQDADMAETIMFLKNAENVYKSALSVGGRIIQPSLVDFLR